MCRFWIDGDTENDIRDEIEQLSTARFVDAHQTPGANYSVVTREEQSNSSQRWLID